jgi:DNA-binding NtrC family response regulator
LAADAIADTDTGFPDNVRELPNLAEWIGVTKRQLYAWAAVQLQRLLMLARNAQ